jgi:hypothetical protein
VTYLKLTKSIIRNFGRNSFIKSTPVVHDDAAQDQEADPGRRGALLEKNILRVRFLVKFFSESFFNRSCFVGWWRMFQSRGKPSHLSVFEYLRSI